MGVQEAGVGLSTAQRVAEEIRNRIVRGVHVTDTYLPSERYLATEFGVSRGTIRSALDMLSTDGLILQSERRGTRVLSPQEKLAGAPIGVVCAGSVFVPAASVNSEFVRLLDGIQDALLRLKLDYKVIPVSPEVPLDSMEALGKCGALLFVETMGQADQILALHRRNVPLVVANLEQDLDLWATKVNHEAAARDGTRLLLAMGHRRIGFLMRHPDRLFYRKAMNGYLNALRAVGIEADDSRIAVVTDYFDPDAAYRAARDLLAREPGITAIVAARDGLARGAWQAAEEKGLVVGRDISIIGFDNVSWPEGQQRLTTFHEPCYEMSVAAVEMLMTQLVCSNRAAPQQREFQAALVMRRSIGPPAPCGDAPPQTHSIRLLPVE